MSQLKLPNRLCVSAMLLATLLGCLAASASAAPPSKKSKAGAAGAGPTDYPSKHFLLHTDLSATEAKELISRLETMIGLISKYWGQPPVGVIECYVVKDQNKWKGVAINPEGWRKIEEGAGVTMTESLRLGQKRISKSIVYAVADHGTPQHEAVHAYCGQTFGTCGPLWYAEGMAEMGQYWRSNEASVKIHPGVLEYLQKSEPKSLNEIINNRAEITGDSWQNYAWRWALCHLLANNPNYSPRFRPLGLGFLTEQKVSFEDTYGAMAEEISFEYRFFLEHIDQGFRADLCAIDWKRKFKGLSGSNAVSASVQAGRGWQPASVTVTENQKIEYSASGTWKMSKDGPELTANGDKAGQGKLLAVVLKDFEFSGILELNEYGTLIAPSDGKLFLRCQDAWNELVDNQGSVTVKFKLAGHGPPLAKPKPKSSAAKPATKSSETDKPRPSDAAEAEQE